MRIVFDTNILVSYVIQPQNPLGTKVDYMLRNTTVLRSHEGFSELSDVLMRRKFDKYVSLQIRQAFLHQLYITSIHVPITRRINACRDEKDNKFLELAVCGQADALITGDADLLALHPFEGIAIIAAAGMH